MSMRWELREIAVLVEGFVPGVVRGIRDYGEDKDARVVIALPDGFEIVLRPVSWGPHRGQGAATLHTADRRDRGHAALLLATEMKAEAVSDVTYFSMDRPKTPIARQIVERLLLATDLVRGRIASKLEAEDAALRRGGEVAEGLGELLGEEPFPDLQGRPLNVQSMQTDAAWLRITVTPGAPRPVRIEADVTPEVAEAMVRAMIDAVVGGGS